MLVKMTEDNFGADHDSVNRGRYHDEYGFPEFSEHPAKIKNPSRKTKRDLNENR